MKRALAFFRAAVLSSVGAFAAISVDATSADSGAIEPGHEDLNVRGIFTSELPDIGRKHGLRLLLHPHIGDLVKYDYLRTDFGLKYAISDTLEISGATSAYFGNGRGDTALFSDLGVGEVKLRAKVRLGDRLLRGWDSAVGVGFSTPINQPPVDVTDGLEHLSFFSTFARPWHPGSALRIFWGWGFESVRETSTRGRHDDNELRDDNQTFSGGFVLDRGRTHYTFEGIWTTSRVIGHTGEDVFEIRPGVIWELGGTREDGSRSRWLLGLAVSTTYGPDGVKFGLGGRIRLDFDLKRMFRHRR